MMSLCWIRCHDALNAPFLKIGTTMLLKRQPNYAQNYSAFSNHQNIVPVVYAKSTSRVTRIINRDEHATSHDVSQESLASKFHGIPKNSKTFTAEDEFQFQPTSCYRQVQVSNIRKRKDHKFAIQQSKSFFRCRIRWKTQKTLPFHLSPKQQPLPWQIFEEWQMIY